MQRTKTVWAKGFTIVEVMIVLAVTGLMFLIAVNATQGLLAKNSFNSGVNDLASTIQNTIEQVSDGQYSDVPIKCESGPPVNASTLEGTNPQGTNQDCVFLGKLIHFYGNPANNYEILPLVDSEAASDYSMTTNVGGLTTNSEVPDDLTISQISYIESGPDASSVTNFPMNIAFVQSQGNSNGQGAQTVNLAFNDYPPANNAAFGNNANAVTHGLTLLSSASICVTDGQRYAKIDLGTDNSTNETNPLTVNVQRGLNSC